MDLKDVVVVKYSNVAEAIILKVPRTQYCVAAGVCRIFPGSFYCSIFTCSNCRASFGCIGGANAQSLIAEEGLDAGAFTSWETTKNTKLWSRFSEHISSRHSVGLSDDGAVSISLKCPKCPTFFRNMQQLFEHCFRLLEDGYFCRICRYPFAGWRSIFRHFHVHHNHKLSDELLVCAFDEYLKMTIPSDAEICVRENDTQYLDAEPVVNSASLISPVSAGSSTAPVLSFSNTGTEQYKFDQLTGHYQCLTCYKRFPHKFAIKNHVTNSHVDRKCRDCFAVFRSAFGYRNHKCSSRQSQQPQRRRIKTSNIQSSQQLLGRVVMPTGTTEDVKPAKRAKQMSKFDFPLAAAVKNRTLPGCNSMTAVRSIATTLTSSSLQREQYVASPDLLDGKAVIMEPVEMEPVKMERVKFEPVEIESVNMEPAEIKYVKMEPAEIEHVKMEPLDLSEYTICDAPVNSCTEQVKIRGETGNHIEHFADDSAQEHLRNTELVANKYIGYSPAGQNEDNGKVSIVEDLKLEPTLATVKIELDDG